MDSGQFSELMAVLGQINEGFTQLAADLSDMRDDVRDLRDSVDSILEAQARQDGEPD